MTSWSILYRSPMIFIYDLDFGRCRLSIEFESTFYMLLRYFSIVDKLRLFTGLLVVMMIPLFVLQLKSVTMSDLEFFRHLLTLIMCMWAELMINSVIWLAIGMMTFFLDSSLVIMLILGFLLPSPLLLIFNTFLTLSIDKAENASLIYTMSSIYKRFDFEACA